MPAPRAGPPASRPEPLQPPPAAGSAGPAHLRILYLFAGQKRRSSVAALVRRRARAAGREVTCSEVDILRSAQHDLSLKRVQEFYLDQLRVGLYDVLVASPPCSTWSRAPWANRLGPAPLRSEAHPWGFPWLGARRGHLRDLANSLAHFAVDAMVLQLRSGRAAVLEQPEDLGAVRDGHWHGHRPASMWQLAEVRGLTDLDDVHTVALFQSDFGAPWAKPTRLLGRLPGLGSDPRFYKGWPTFDDAGLYCGPLPRAPPGLLSLVRKPEDQGFRTSGTAAWPEQLCAFVAEAALLVPPSAPSSASGGALACGPPAESAGEATEAAEAPHLPPRRGPPVARGRLQAGEVYIGRGGGRHESRGWGNPYPVKRWGRAGAIQQFQANFEGSGLVQRLGELTGKVLRCHCAVGQACHGDVLVQEWLARLGPRCIEPVRELAPEAGPGPRPQAPQRARGGVGPPRRIRMPDKDSEFHDGAGLISPGRWDLEQRIYPPWEDLREKLRERAEERFGDVERLAFEIAAGRSQRVEAGDEPSDLFDKDALVGFRELLADWLAQPGRAGCGRPLLDVAPGQPIRLELLGALLREAGDPEAGLMDELREGVTAGILHGMPRVPEVFEELTRWRLDQDPIATAVEEAYNYSSAEEEKEWLEGYLREEVEAGRMVKYTREDFKQKYAQRAIASVAVLVAPSGKKRLVHDGTHKVAVNHRIRCRNKQRMPGPREMNYLLDHYKRNHVVLVGVASDVKRAHRLIKIREDEWGMLACALSSDDPFVYCNTVGTFGICSASEWWYRLFGAGIRAVHALLGGDLPAELLAYADDLEAVAPGARGRRAVALAILFLCILGFPLQASKTKGGVELDWIGLHVDFAGYRLGLSAERAAWLAAWARSAVARGRIPVREAAAALGRLGFAALVLVWERPLLGVLYSWVSAVWQGGAAVAALPWAARLVLQWIAERLEQGERMQDPLRVVGDAPELFRTDARAEDGRCWIGGWEVVPGQQLGEARWFAAEVTKDWFPWPWQKEGDPKRVIAALELLGSLVAFKVFARPRDGLRRCTTYATGTTDNQGNMYAVKKALSTKWPLTVLLVELAMEMRAQGVALNLMWVKRDLNEEADRLSNMNVDGFAADREVRLDPQSLRWHALGTLMPASAELFEEIKRERAGRKRGAQGAPPGRPAKRSRRAALAPW